MSDVKIFGRHEPATIEQLERCVAAAGGSLRDPSPTAAGRPPPKAAYARAARAYGVDAAAVIAAARSGIMISW